MSDAQDQYRKEFGLGEPPEPEKAEKAFNLALDIRKFEIGLYWQRAAYFWALIAAAFAGYFAILGSEHLEDKEYLAYIVSCIGLIFSWAWLLVNRGSKYWQENWENHVDMLENAIVGPLYKTILHRPENRNFVEKHILGPQAISVSQINLLVSIFTLLIWAMLVAHSLPPFHYSWAVSWKHVAVGGVTLVFILFMRLKAASHLGSHQHVVTQRSTEIVESTKQAPSNSIKPPSATLPPNPDSGEPGGSSGPLC